MPISYEEVAEIIKIMNASSCEELVLELDGLKLVLRRHVEGSAQPRQAAEMAPDASNSGSSTAPVRSPAAHLPENSAATATPVAGNKKRADGLFEVRSPMVGTFYRAPSPNEKPFVEIGAAVSEGDPLCLIEVMKLFTTIGAKQAGRLAEVCAEDGQLVEFEQLLFMIEPA